MSHDAAVDRLCGPGQPFEICEVIVRGRTVRYWRNVPENLVELAREVRDRHASREFLVYAQERVSYDGWFSASATLGHALTRLGVRKGERVAIAMRNLPEWPVAFFGAASAGAIVVPLNGWWTGGELQYALADAGVRLLICDHEQYLKILPLRHQLPDLREIIVTRGPTENGDHRLSDLIGEATCWDLIPPIDFPPVAIAPDDDLFIFYTSGTTGSPKGALGTHRNMMVGYLAFDFFVNRMLLREGGVPTGPEPGARLVAVPMFHVTACCSLLMANLRTGGKMVFMHKWDPSAAMALIERERITTTGGVPTIPWQLIEAPDRKNYDLSSLTSISTGGGPAAPELVRLLDEDLSVLPVTGYGLTETSAAVAGFAGEDYRRNPEACGLALPIVDIRIMDVEGDRELPRGEVGEIWVYGPQIVKEYWCKPEASALTFVDGWARTGDIGRLDEEGYIYIVDRAKDIVIRGGENIYSSEVENVLYDHPAVTDAALIGLPHRTLGEVPAAVVHLFPGARVDEAELRSWVALRLAAFKVPVSIAFCEAPLPRNANGKILKRELKELFVA
jgi:acyl-CoA synthetase (AMP-forming)/AMP-acid ligase II